MFSFKRSERVGETIHREISAIISEEVKDPRIGFFTITGVEITDSLAFAKVFISPMGSDKDKANTFKGIASASRFIRSRLGKRLRMKKIPEISFRLDTSPEHADTINRILHSLDDKGED